MLYFLSIRWDTFIQNESSARSKTERGHNFIRKSSICLKVLTIWVTFAVVLVAGCASKGALFFMIAQMPMLTTSNGTNPPLKYCYKNIREGDQNITYEVTYGEKETIAWMW